MDMETIASGLKNTLEGIGETLGPEDDWIPVMLMYGGEKDAIVGLPSLADHKEVMSDLLIPKLIADHKPEFVALVTMGWAKDYDVSTLEGTAELARDEAMYEVGNIADRPGKYETLVGHIVDKDGNEAQLFGYVHRHPTLSPTIQWRDDLCTDIPKDKSAGRFPDALRKAMWEHE